MKTSIRFYSTITDVVETIGDIEVHYTNYDPIVNYFPEVRDDSKRKKCFITLNNKKIWEDFNDKNKYEKLGKFLEDNKTKNEEDVLKHISHF